MLKIENRKIADVHHLILMQKHCWCCKCHQIGANVVHMVQNWIIINKNKKNNAKGYLFSFVLILILPHYEVKHDN